MKCDCTSYCGDDPRIAQGKAKPCETFVRSQRWNRILTNAERIVQALKTTKGNIESLRQACNCKTYDVWLKEISEIIADVEGAA